MVDLTDKRERLLALQRPHCPECAMRMMAIQPGAETFECLRCGYVGPALKREAAQ